jgi:hypothetical protein
MSTLTSSTFRPAPSFFANIMSTIDRLLLAWHEISVRNGDIPRYGL